MRSTPNTITITRYKEKENSMMNDKMEEIKTAGNTPSVQTESTCVIQGMAIVLKVLFGMEACAGQVLIVYHCLYPILNGYDIIKKLIDDWQTYHAELSDIDERCFLIVSNNDETFLIGKENGQICVPIWKLCKDKLPDIHGLYFVMKANGFVSSLLYEPEFGDKGWNYFCDENGNEHYIKVDKWCTYADLKPFDPAEGIL